MAKLAGRFTGRELDRPVLLSAYDEYLEVSIEDTDGAVAIRVSLEELESVDIEEILGLPVLVIRDRSGIDVAAIRMEPDDASRAKEVIDSLRLPGN